MGTITRIAWRNLLRHRRRTLITGSAIALGLALMVFTSGLADGTHNSMIRKGVSQMAGHVVVQGLGFQKSKNDDIAVPNTPEVVSTLEAAFPDQQIVQRVFAAGLLTSPYGSAGVGLSGVEPEIERQLTDLDDKMVEGEYISGHSQIVIGANLADTLDVGVGDKVVLMSQQGKDISSFLFRVSGIFKTGIDDVDGFYGQITLPDARKVMALGKNVTQVSVHLASAKDTASATARAQQALKGQPVEVLPWQKALPNLYQYVLIDNGGMYVMMAIIALIVVAGILNTVLMSIMERMKEFGVMLAVGMNPKSLGVVIMVETLMLGIGAVVVGVALGLMMNYPIATSGLDFGALAGGSMEAGGVNIDSVVYSELSAMKVVLFSMVTLAMTLIAALYPAWKVTRLEALDALHHRN